MMNFVFFVPFVVKVPSPRQNPRPAVIEGLRYRHLGLNGHHVNPPLVAVHGHQSLDPLEISDFLEEHSLRFGMQLEQGVAEPERRPNVIFLTVDTLRADHLAQYGYHRATMPGLAGLGADVAPELVGAQPTPWAARRHSARRIFLEGTK